MPLVLFDKRGHTAYITINRPETMNALNRDTWDALTAAWISVRDDPEVWTAIVTGAGDKAFSAGTDLLEAKKYREHLERGEPINKPRVPDVSPCRNLDVWKPFIAAINGFCLAGGLEIALACDIRIAADHAVFGCTEVTRAVIPGAGATQRLPRIIPFATALELMITGERISAQKALSIGLVNYVVAGSNLMAAAEALADKINANGPIAVRLVKEAAYRGLSMPIHEGLRLEKSFSELVHHTEDAREGPLAFVEKREPKYQAR